MQPNLHEVVHSINLPINQLGWIFGHLLKFHGCIAHIGKSITTYAIVFSTLIFSATFRLDKDRLLATKCKLNSQGPRQRLLANL